MNLCKKFGHQWATLADETHRSCFQCKKKQHRAPGGPWVDLRDRVAKPRKVMPGQSSLFE